MFALVALLAFYIGVRNIRKSFFLSPFTQWNFLNWTLFIMGIILIIIGIACTLRAVKDYKTSQTEKEEKEKLEKQKRQEEFFYDDNE